MSITEILEKYAQDTFDEFVAKEIPSHFFPALTSELEQHEADVAVKFAEWIDRNGYFIDEQGGWFSSSWIMIANDSSELYALFLTNKNKTDDTKANS
jgi:hypothetical protein